MDETRCGLLLTQEDKPIPCVPWSALIGFVFLQFRKKGGLTQEEVSKAIGSSQSSYAKMEKGLCLMNSLQVDAFASLFESSVGEIYDRTERLEQHCKKRGYEVALERICKDKKEKGYYLMGSDLPVFFFKRILTARE